jgi:hypothetical protein
MTSRRAPPYLALVATLAAPLGHAACSTKSPTATATPVASAPATGPAAAAAALPPAPARGALARGEPCSSVLVDAGATVGCARFKSAEDAFRAVVDTTDPLVLAIGEAHAQKGTEALASSTKRFTASLLPIASGRASDVVVELWAPNPACRKEVQAVASAQKPVVTAQATSNVNEYEALGTRAKALGTTPWLLRPTCDDFKAITDAGDGAIPVMLGLVRSLTTARVRQLLARNAADGGAPRMVLAYGGMMHNDLLPPAATKDYSFAPELVQATAGRYVELDLVVPEYVKPSPTWQALPWYAAYAANAAYATHEAVGADPERVTLYQTGERSFVLVFARTPAAADAGPPLATPLP